MNARFVPGLLAALCGFGFATTAVSQDCSEEFDMLVNENVLIDEAQRPQIRSYRDDYIGELGAVAGELTFSYLSYETQADLLSKSEDLTAIQAGNFVRMDDYLNCTLAIASGQLDPADAIENVLVTLEETYPESARAELRARAEDALGL